jgi:hypothetical protein
MANWWDEAYSDIANWSVNADQLNADRGAYKDAFQMNAAEKGLNYDVTSRLMDKSSNQERETMQLSADLDRRNTLDLMTGENQFKIAGMQEANRLSQDYLAAEGAENRANLQEQGSQSRLTQETANRGMADVEAIRAAASNYGQDADTKRAGIAAGSSMYQSDAAADASRYGSDAQAGASRYASDANVRSTGLQADAQKYAAEAQSGASRYASDAGVRSTELQAGASRFAQEEESRRVGLQGEQDRLNYAAQGDQQRRGMETQGAQDRLSIGTRGEQERATVSRTAEEQRKTGISDREHAAGLAVRYSRR